MPKVHWDWGLLTTTSAGSGSSHRVARKGTTAISAPAAGGYAGDDDAQSTGGGWSWTPSSAARAPAKLLAADGKNFVFAFWWIQGGTTGGVRVGNSIVNNPGGFSVPVGGDGNASARAFYVWDFGSGAGANAILIDAFDQDTGFFPEDFVNVYPEDGRAHGDPMSLYYKANDGYLVTDPPSADVTQQETLTAFNPSGRKFLYWLEIAALTYPTQGGPAISGTDATVMPSARLVAFAVYTTPAPEPIYLNIPRTTGWWVSHGVMVDAGGIRIGPGGVEPVPPWNPDFRGMAVPVSTRVEVLRGKGNPPRRKGRSR